MTNPGPRKPSAQLRLVRRLIGCLEWALRPTVLDRGLPEVAVCRRDVVYGEHEKHRLDVLACPGSEPAPLLVYVHGGAWVTGDKSNFKWVTHSFASAGLVVVSLNYRWAPEAGLFDQLRDVAQAIAWCRTNARELGGDPGRVFLAGDSAGAHLVCWLHMALHRPDLLEKAGLLSPLPAVAQRGSLLFYGVYDLLSAWELGAAFRTPIRSVLGAEPAAIPELADLASPVRHVASGAAPVFLAVGSKDPLWGQSAVLAEALRREGVPTRALFLDRKAYPDAGHSFINFGRRRSSQVALREALLFVGELLGDVGQLPASLPGRKGEDRDERGRGAASP